MKKKNFAKSNGDEVKIETTYILVLTSGKQKK